MTLRDAYLQVNEKISFLLHILFYVFCFHFLRIHRTSHWRCFVKKMFLKIPQNSPENICAKVSFLKSCRTQVCNFIKKETLTQMFSCEFCEISESTFFTIHLPATACITMTSSKEALKVSKFNFCQNI